MFALTMNNGTVVMCLIYCVGCDSYGKCPPGALCDPVWVVPLQHDYHVLSISGKMENEGLGQLLPLPQ